MIPAGLGAGAGVQSEGLEAGAVGEACGPLSLPSLPADPTPARRALDGRGPSSQRPQPLRSGDGAPVGAAPARPRPGTREGRGVAESAGGSGAGRRATQAEAAPWWPRGRPALRAQALPTPTGQQLCLLPTPRGSAEALPGPRPPSPSRGLRPARAGPGVPWKWGDDGRLWGLRPERRDRRVSPPATCPPLQLQLLPRAPEAPPEQKSSAVASGWVGSLPIWTLGWGPRQWTLH